MGKKGRARKAQRRKQKKNKEMKNMSKAPSNYKTTTKTTWATPSKANCHTGQSLIFTTTGGIDVYGGGRNRAGGWWKAPVVVDLAMGPDETMAPFNKSALSGGTIVPAGWSCDDHTGRIDPPKYMIELDFPDFGVPQVDKLFWYALCDDIVEHNIKSISTQCAGGHGRTGVQLCILYYLLNDDDVKSTITDAGQLIELIRELHCDHAVETDGQQRYIARVLDIDVGDSKIESTYGGWGGGYSYGGGGSGKAKSITGKASPTSTTTTTKNKTTGTTTGYDLSEEFKMLPKPVQSNALTFEECECCGEVEYNVDTEECTNCGWKMPDPSADTMLCYNCGATKNPTFFLSPADETCVTCVADEMKVKRQGEKIQCGTCKELRYADMFSETTADGKFVCMACEVKQ
jgi:ribosomal protein L37E